MSSLFRAKGFSKSSTLATCRGTDRRGCMPATVEAIGARPVTAPSRPTTLNTKCTSAAASGAACILPARIYGNSSATDARSKNANGHADVRWRRPSGRSARRERRPSCSSRLTVNRSAPAAASTSRLINTWTLAAKADTTKHAAEEVSASTTRRRRLGSRGSPPRSRRRRSARPLGPAWRRALEIRRAGRPHNVRGLCTP